MDIERLYRDYGIYYQTEGHKHCRDGWVNTSCPFCTGNPGLHLGFDLNDKKFVCWRCGGHRMYTVLSTLLNVEYREIPSIIRDYGFITKDVRTKKFKIKKKQFRYPEPLSELQNNHKKYLIERGFDQEELTKFWGLMGTGPVALLDKLNYCFRIIIPFEWDGKIVSFDSRDITDKQNNKYQACPDARELIGHKQILYGKQISWGDTGICVEGPTDVWRFGENSFATSGIKYTPKQLRIMSKTFKRVAVVFDDEVQAQIQANKLVADLRFRGVDAFKIKIEGDPGSMEQKEANYLVKQIIK